MYQFCPISHRIQFLTVFFSEINVSEEKMSTPEVIPFVTHFFVFLQIQIHKERESSWHAQKIGEVLLLTVFLGHGFSEGETKTNVSCLAWDRLRSCLSGAFQKIEQLSSRDRLTDTHLNLNQHTRSIKTTTNCIFKF